MISASVPAARLFRTTPPRDRLLFTDVSPAILAKLIVASFVSVFLISKFSMFDIVAPGKFAAVLAAPSTA